MVPDILSPTMLQMEKEATALLSHLEFDISFLNVSRNDGSPARRARAPRLTSDDGFISQEEFEAQHTGLNHGRPLAACGEPSADIEPPVMEEEMARLPDVKMLARRMRVVVGLSAPRHGRRRGHLLHHRGEAVLFLSKQ